MAICVEAAWAEDGLTTTDLFPLQEKHVHSSSVVECPNGDLLVCWFEGSGERTANDVMVRGARLRAGESQWSAPFLMADTPDLPDCNPVLYIDRHERLWLFWIAVQANRWEYSLLKYRRADEYQQDGPPRWAWQDVIILKPGDTFTDALRAGFDAVGLDEGMWAEYAPPYRRMLIEAARDPYKRQTGWMTRTHPLTLPSGRMLLPLYSDGFNISLVAVSDDDGEQWRVGGPIVGIGPTQPSLVRRRDGAIVAYMRDTGSPPNRVLRSTSEDEGETWSPAVDTDIPNPDSSVEVVALASGRWIMIHNDTERGRYRLTASLSDDEGASWRWQRGIAPTGDDAGSFSYPSVIQGRDGRIHVTFSRHVSAGKTIRHAVFDEAWVMGE